MALPVSARSHLEASGGEPASQPQLSRFTERPAQRVRIKETLTGTHVREMCLPYIFVPLSDCLAEHRETREWRTSGMTLHAQFELCLVGAHDHVLHLHS